VARSDFARDFAVPLRGVLANWWPIVSRAACARALGAMCA
jgi:hypothetical protein